ncbi:hypothetical protein [Streptomyces sp. WM4235]|uniref:hypothetical protein n=1 Tax=Streptomyces sp. WM4235 TaxID=1415551 RepID=UPI000AA9AAFC|nr:hypothetical protein [Streptomyces sp. WM4235]
MGKASRGKKQRNRDTAGTWSAAKAARTAHQARADTRRLLRDNVWVLAMLTSNVNNRMAKLQYWATATYLSSIGKTWRSR